MGGGSPASELLLWGREKSHSHFYLKAQFQLHPHKGSKGTRFVTIDPRKSGGGVRGEWATVSPGRDSPPSLVTIDEETQNRVASTYYL